MYMATLREVVHNYKCIQVSFSKSVSRPSGLNSNSNSHHTLSHTRPFICDQGPCQNRFATKTHLERHMNTKHDTVKKFHCPVQKCSRSRIGGRYFNRKDNCRRHVKEKHIDFDSNGSLEAEVDVVFLEGSNCASPDY